MKRREGSLCFSILDYAYVCVRSAFNAVLLISGIFFAGRRQTQRCLFQHYRHHLLPCLAVPPVIRFYVRAQSPFSVSDNASANFG